MAAFVSAARNVLKSETPMGAEGTKQKETRRRKGELGGAGLLLTDRGVMRMAHSDRPGGSNAGGYSGQPLRGNSGMQDG